MTTNHRPTKRKATSRESRGKTSLGTHDMGDAGTLESAVVGRRRHSAIRTAIRRRSSGRPDMRAIYTAVLVEAVGLFEHAGISYQLPMPVSYWLYRRILFRGGSLSWWFAKARNGLQDGSYPSMVADVTARNCRGDPVAIAAYEGVQS
jgi:hypothetical protein